MFLTTPEINTIKMATGSIYLIRKKKMRKTENFMCPLIASSLAVIIFFNIHPTYIEINKPPNGNNIFDDMKSIKSKNDFPKIFSCGIIPNDSEHKIPIAKIQTDTNVVAKIRLMCNSSTQNATTTSISEIAEVIAVINNKTKKMIEKIIPPAIC